jgi:hypothetical protein
MNHYQKLATLLVRCAGMATASLGLMGCVYGSVLLTRGAQFTPEQFERFTASFWYALVGVVVFLVGRPLGRLLGRKLE